MGYEELLKEARAQYDKSRAAANEAMDARRRQAEQIRDEALKTLTQNYNTDADTVRRRYGQALLELNQRADKGLNEAWLSRMGAEKNLGQQLAAVGQNGGAAQSSILALQNRYLQQRADTERDRREGAAQNDLAQNDALNALLKALRSDKAKTEDNYTTGLEKARELYEKAVQQAESLYATARQKAEELKAEEEARAAEAEREAAREAEREAAKQKSSTSSGGGSSSGGSGGSSGGNSGGSSGSGSGGDSSQSKDQSTAEQLSLTLRPLVRRGYTRQEMQAYLQRLGYGSGVISAALGLMGY